MRIQDTGRKVFHPPTCGRCHGAGCPIVELVLDDHETHVSAHVTSMPRFDPSVYPERNTLRERFAHRFLRRDLPMTSRRATAAWAAMAEHIQAHERALDAVSGVSPLSRGPVKIGDLTES